jgi:hypothetical protein
VRTFKKLPTKLFTDFNPKLNGWCRKAFVSKGKVKTRAEIDNGLLLYLSKKLHETDVLNHGQLMDLLAWSYLETEIFPGWFAVTHNWTNSLKDVETHLRCNGMNQLGTLFSWQFSYLVKTAK